MIFAIAFIMACGLMAVPLRADFKKHGRDNIIRRSGRDVAEFAPVAGTLALVGSVFETVKTAFAMSALGALVFVLLYFLWNLLR